MRKKSLLTAGLLTVVLVLPGLANKSSVSIQAPAAVKAGAEATIKISVAHRGNSSLHYTNRVVVLADKKEIARWSFSSSNRPEAENFSREVTLKIEAETEITAEANCNLHGSAGPATVRIRIEE